MRQLFAIVLCVGCGREQALEPSTAATQRPWPPEAATAGAEKPDGAPPAWFRAAQFFPRAVEHSFPSAHFAKPHIAQIHVNPEALEAYGALVADTRFPSGTLLVQRLREAESGRPGPVLALERTQEGWRFWMLDSVGRVDEAASLEFCAACHAGAVAPPVFGLVRTLANGE